MEYDNADISKISKSLEADKSKSDLNMKINFNDIEINDNDQTIYDKIIEDYGYKSETWKILISVFCCFIIIGYNTTYFSVLVNVYIELFDLNENHIGTIGSIFFFSKAIGYITIGYLTHFFNRCTIARLLIVILICLTFIQILWKNYYFMLLVRTYEGFESGCLEIISLNVLCEYLPIKFRGFFLTVIWSGYAFGQLIINIVTLIVNPNMNVKNLNFIFIIFSVILILCGLVVFLFFKQSPKMLILQKKYFEAFEILSKYKNNEYFDDKIKSQLIKEIEHGENGIITNSLIVCTELFNKNYLLVTICIIYSMTASEIILDGTNLIQNIILKKVKESPRDVVISNIVINIFFLISQFVYGLLSEMKSLGRIYTIFSGFICLFIITILCLFFPKLLTILFGLLMFFASVNNLLSTYAAEVYPTKIHDLATGFITSLSNIGSAIAQFIFIYLENLSYQAPFYFLIFLSLSSGIFILFSPIETNGKALDKIKLKISNPSEENLNLLKE